MSAAEKLGKLNEAMVAAEKPWLATTGQIALSDAAISDLAEALPQIVAVVKAAEGYPFDAFSLDKLRLALAALDEALP